MTEHPLNDTTGPQPPPPPLFLRALLAMALATAGLQLARAALGIIHLAGERKTFWTSGSFEGFQYVVIWLFTMLLPALLVVGAIGVWLHKPGARRLTVLAAGALVVIACVELVVGLAPLFQRPPRVLEVVEALLNVGQSFLSGSGLLLLLVIVLRRGRTSG
jgi:hypothetical protein